MTWDEVKELGPLYAIGALDAETKQHVAEFLRDAPPAQQREFAAWAEVAALLPQALPQTAPPLERREQLLGRIAATAQETVIDEPLNNVLPFTPARLKETRIPRWLLAAATIALTFASSYLLWQNLKLASERNNLRDQVNSLRQQFNNFVAPTTRVIAMAGEEAPQASAKVVWDTARQEWVIYVYNLPVPPGDQDYQLWYVTKDSKISAAVFRPDAQGRIELRLSLPPQAVSSGLAATAVTLEPRGGSAQPTGKFFLKAAI